MSFRTATCSLVYFPVVSEAQAAIDVPYTEQFWGGLHYNGNNALLDGSSVSNSNNWCESQLINSWSLQASMTDRLLGRDRSGQCFRCMDGPHDKPTLGQLLVFASTLGPMADVLRAWLHSTAGMGTGSICGAGPK